ncbi:MAG: hypothetical protein KC620_24300, partial [Myxococcales bacterium]|nr:hypothetical protein [Myxococcales bacterium]
DPVEDNYRKAQAHARAGEGEATAEALRAAFAAASDAESLRRRTNVDPAFDAVRAHPAVEAVLAMPARKP